MASSIRPAPDNADASGKLFVLEANPKPDLKKPAAGVTSFISAGLPEVGMEYDDLILSLLADRLGFLFTHRRSVVRHLFDLMEMPNLFDLMRSPASDEVNEITTDLNVLALNATLKNLKARTEIVNAYRAITSGEASSSDTGDHPAVLKQSTQAK